MSTTSSQSKKPVPAIEGWIDIDPENPRLVGYKDDASGTYFFPKDVAISRAPGFADTPLREVRLSNRGKLWSYTTNHYKPPEPAIVKDPFVPYTVAAVELTEERMVILGQLADGIDVGEHGRTVAAAGQAAGGQLPRFFRGNRPPSGQSM